MVVGLGNAGFHMTARELQTRTHEGPCASKHHQNSTRRTPRETQKERNGGGSGKKKARNFCAPHTSGEGTDFGQSIFANPFLDLVCVTLGPERWLASVRLTPYQELCCWGWTGWQGATSTPVCALATPVLYGVACISPSKSSSLSWRRSKAREAMLIGRREFVGILLKSFLCFCRSVPNVG